MALIRKKYYDNNITEALNIAIEQRNVTVDDYNEIHMTLEEIVTFDSHQERSEIIESVVHYYVNEYGNYQKPFPMSAGKLLRAV